MALVDPYADDRPSSVAAAAYLRGTSVVMVVLASSGALWFVIARFIGAWVVR